MNETNQGTARDDRAGPPGSHAMHDSLLIVALASDDLEGDDRTNAERLVATCSDCRLLFDDVRAIASSTAVLPAMPRRRDFQLTPQDAARLRPMGWRRFVAAFAGTRFAVTRPLAIGLTTLGLAGLIISAVPNQGGFAFGTMSAPNEAGDRLAAGAPDSAHDATGGAHVPQSVDLSTSAASAGPVSAASAPPPAPSSAASAAATSLPQPPATSLPRASASGGGTDGLSASNPATKNDQSPGSTFGQIAGGNYGTDTTGGVPPPDANGSGKIVPAVPAALQAVGTGSGPAPLTVVSVLLLLAGIGLLAARSAARRIR